jgi:hypothetical protein
MSDKAKPGYKTTEFWSAVITQVLGLLMLLGILEPSQGSSLGGGEAQAIGGLMAGLSTLGYSLSRGTAKRALSVLLVAGAIVTAGLVGPTAAAAEDDPIGTFVAEMVGSRWTADIAGTLYEIEFVREQAPFGPGYQSWVDVRWHGFESGETQIGYATTDGHLLKLHGGGYLLLHQGRLWLFGDVVFERVD